MARLHLRKMTVLSSMLNFTGYLFSFLKGIYNTCAIHTKVNSQVSVARNSIARFFEIYPPLLMKFFSTCKLTRKKITNKNKSRTILNKTLQNSSYSTAKYTKITKIYHLLPIIPRNHLFST